MSKDLYSGDVYLFNTLDGGEIDFKNGQPILDQGLETAVYISVFSKASWQNDLDFNNISRQTNSRFEEILFGTLTNQSRLNAIRFAEDSLLWLKKDRIADKIEIDAFIINGSKLLTVIDIFKPNEKNALTFKFITNWENQETFPAHKVEKNAG